MLQQVLKGLLQEVARSGESDERLDRAGLRIIQFLPKYFPPMMRVVIRTHLSRRRT